MSLFEVDSFTYLIASRSILFLFYTAIDHHRMRYFSILRIRKYDPHKLLIHPNRVYLSFIVCVLKHSDFGFCPHHRLIIAFILPWFVPPSFLVVAVYFHLECHIVWSIWLLSLKPFDLWLEATRHSHLLLTNSLFGLIRLVATRSDFAGLLIKLRLLKRWAIEGCGVLNQFIGAGVIISWSWCLAADLEHAIFLIFAKDEGHYYVV